MRTDRPPAEPILLNQAALEHVLDAFLPEDPAAAVRARTSGVDTAESFFASETPEEALDDLPIRATPEFERPWRTYSSPLETDRSGAIEPLTTAAVSRTGRRVRSWVIAAAVAIGCAAIGSIAIRPLLNRTPDAVQADDKPPVSEPPLLVPAARTPDMAAARPSATPVEVRGEANREARVPDVLPPVTGAVLKGSLTPDSKPGRPPELTTPPRQDAVRAAPPSAVKAPPPIEAPAASRESLPGRSTSPEPVAVANPPPAPPVAPAPPPPAPTAARDAAAATREPPPAPSATATAPEVPTAAADAASIEAVLNRYRQAFRALDTDAARAVWPGVDARALGRAFDQLVEQQLEFQTCSITVDSAHATAACGGRARYVPKVGSRSVRDEPRQWTFSLRKVNGQWLIERVASR